MIRGECREVFGYLVRRERFGVAIMGGSPSGSVFDEGFQSGERLIPPLRDEIEVVARFGERFWVELVAAFAAGAAAAHNANVFEHAKVLRNRLTSEPRACGELRDGMRLAAGQTRDEEKTSFVSERREERCRTRTMPVSDSRRRTTDSSRHIPRCCAFAGSSLRHF